jgi:hypothetical protein
MPMKFFRLTHVNSPKSVVSLSSVMIWVSRSAKNDDIYLCSLRKRTLRKFTASHSMGPLTIGAITGVIHHFSFQYPRQARLFPTLIAISFANMVFVFLLLLAQKECILGGCSHILKQLILFNTSFVTLVDILLT